MKKLEIARRLARRSGLTQAEAADCLDRVVHGLRRELRQGKSVALPGLGAFTHDGAGRVCFAREAAQPNG